MPPEAAIAVEDPVSIQKASGHFPIGSGGWKSSSSNTNYPQAMIPRDAKS
jgi:hypothetical protein